MNALAIIAIIGAAALVAVGIGIIVSLRRVVEILACIDTELLNRGRRQ